MAAEIKIPIPDQTTLEVRIVKWQKKTGDKIVKGENVLEVETDKSVIEVEATEDGILLSTLAAENDMVPVGEVVGYIGQAGEQVPAGTSTTGASAENGNVNSNANAATNSTADNDQAVAGGIDANPATPAGVTEIKIPIPDQTTQEVRIVKWQKAMGDKVAKGDNVLEVETDKSVIEVEALESGVLLKTLYNENDMVPVGEVAGYIGKEGTQLNSVGTATASAVSGTVQANTKANNNATVETINNTLSAGGRIKASPVARKLAEQLGVNLAMVAGTGPGGRIVKQDVQSFATGVNTNIQPQRQAQLQAPVSTATAAAKPVAITGVGGRILASPLARRLARELGIKLSAISGTGPGGRIVAQDVRAFADNTATIGQQITITGTIPAAGQPAAGTEVVLTKMRRAIGMNLQSSSRDIPHFNTTISIDMTRAMQVRQQLNEGLEKARKVSVNDLIIRACARALQQYPAVNSQLKDDKIMYMAEVNIGVATAIDTGLVVPVLLNADKLSWYDLSSESKKLAQQARMGKLLNYGKGTFTISNLGMFGIDNFTAIINPPEAAILAVGATQDTVVAIDGGIGVRPIMKVTLCSDHRLIDGALAAMFLRAIKLYLEEQISTEN